MRILALAILLAALGACASMPPASNRMAPDRAPTPYSAAQIRAACDGGRVSVFLVQQPGTLEPSMLQVFRFGKGSLEEASFEIALQSTDGKPMGKPRGARAAWTALQAHASFRAADTKITEASIRTPAGRFACWLYSVTGRDAGKPQVSHYYFAKNLAGPPVRLVQQADGVETYSMTLIEHSPPK